MLHCNAAHRDCAEIRCGMLTLSWTNYLNKNQAELNSVILNPLRVNLPVFKAINDAATTIYHHPFGVLTEPSRWLCWLWLEAGFSFSCFTTCAVSVTQCTDAVEMQEWRSAWSAHWGFFSKYLVGQAGLVSAAGPLAVAHVDMMVTVASYQATQLNIWFMLHNVHTFSRCVYKLFWQWKSFQDRVQWNSNSPQLHAVFAHKFFNQD